MQAAKVKLGYAVVTSPLTGVVLSKNVEPGEYVAPGTPVVTVADIKNVWLRAYVRRARHRQADCRFGQPGGDHHGRLSWQGLQGPRGFISSEQEFTPKTVQTERERVKFVYRIKIYVNNPDRELKPGMPADAKLKSE